MNYFRTCSLCRCYREVFYNDFAWFDSHYFGFSLCFECYQEIWPEDIGIMEELLPKKKLSACKKCGKKTMYPNEKCYFCTIGRKPSGGFNYSSLTEDEKQACDFLDRLSTRQDIYVSRMDKKGQEIISTRSEVYQYYDIPYNLFKMLPCMIIIEIEQRPNDADNRARCWAIAREVCDVLDKKEKTYLLFYAEGMNAPHIWLFDFQLEKLGNDERRTARRLFVSSVVPSKYHELIDNHFFFETKVPIPYARHWKYKTFYRPLFFNDSNKFLHKEIPWK